MVDNFGLLIYSDEKIFSNSEQKHEPTVKEGCYKYRKTFHDVRLV